MLKLHFRSIAVGAAVEGQAPMDESVLASEDRHEVGLLLTAHGSCQLGPRTVGPR
jgi:hypothetical protein